jgi:ferric-dicitrate binding protein FerR (iron transport regulator)
MSHIDPREALARYFSGEATVEERANVDAWRQASAENKRVFAQFEKIWQGAAEKLPQLPDADQTWAELAAKLEFPNQKPAAKIFAMKKTPQPGARKFSWSDRYVWAAAAILVLGFATILYQFLYNANELKTISAAYGRRESLKLPDGSLAQLNSGSEIKFYKKFSDSARFVMLSGEAYFEVTPGRRPFYVNTDNAQIRVLGTKFGIWARQEQTRVIVREGRVSLRAAKGFPETAVVLAANQASVCHQQNNPEAPRTIAANHLLGWLEEKIVFDQTPLAEVIAELQRVYNVSIELANPALGQNTITGSFQKKTIASILASICLTLNLRYTKEKNRFVISE